MVMTTDRIRSNGALFNMIEYRKVPNTNEPICENRDKKRIK